MIRLILIFYLCLAFCACEDKKHNMQIISNAETSLPNHPDSALAILEAIDLPESLNDATFSRWGMVYCRAADKLGREMPDPLQLIRIVNYYRQNDMLPEQAEAALYLGRSYVEEKEYEKAMQTYLPALETALRVSNYNLGGYINSYMADLYDLEDIHVLAAEKYQEAAECFLKTGNRRSYTFALRDQGRMYAFMDSCKEALMIFQKAEKIGTELQDTAVMTGIYNGLGNIYELLENWQLAEYYYKKSIQTDSLDSAPNYLALASLYRNKKDFSQAYTCLLKASTPTHNLATSRDVLGEFYLLEKERGNKEKALEYLEKYGILRDSVIELQNRMDIWKIEKKYEKIKVISENMKLRIARQQGYILAGILLFVCSILLIIYLIRIKQKNKLIYYQQEVLLKKDIYTLNLSLDLQRKKEDLKSLKKCLEENRRKIQIQTSLEEQEKIYRQKEEELKKMNDELLQLRQEKFQVSTIYKKINKLARKVRPQAVKSPLNEKDWDLVIHTIDEVYFPLSEHLKTTYGLTPVELKFCYLIFFELDTNGYSILLHISPDSVNKYRQRVRQKLGIVGKNYDLYKYLTNLQL